MRAALVQEHKTRWPTIESDLHGAGENGLSAAAKADGKGWWWEGLALAWATARGKVHNSAADQTSALSTAMHRITR